MAVCSVPDKVRGDFEYYEYSDSIPINDDLPTPSYSGVGELGLAASEAARPLPRGARKVGRGFVPRGSICKKGGFPWMSTSSGATPSGLAGLSQVPNEAWGVAAAFAIFAVVAIGFGRKS